jgi:hypothetical protein
MMMGTGRMTATARADTELQKKQDSFGSAGRRLLLLCGLAVA